MEYGIIKWEKSKHGTNWPLSSFIRAIIEMGVKIEAQVVDAYEQTDHLTYGHIYIYPIEVSLVCSSSSEGVISYCRYQLTDEK